MLGLDQRKHFHVLCAPVDDPTAANRSTREIVPLDGFADPLRTLQSRKDAHLWAIHQNLANLIDGCPAWQTLLAQRTRLTGSRLRLVDRSLGRRFHPVPITRPQRRSCRTVQGSIVLQRKASVGKFPLRTAFGSLSLAIHREGGLICLETFE